MPERNPLQSEAVETVLQTTKGGNGQESTNDCTSAVQQINGSSVDQTINSATGSTDNKDGIPVDVKDNGSSADTVVQTVVDTSKCVIEKDEKNDGTTETPQDNGTSVDQTTKDAPASADNKDSTPLDLEDSFPSADTVVETAVQAVVQTAKVGNDQEDTKDVIPEVKQDKCTSAEETIKSANIPEVNINGAPVDENVNCPPAEQTTNVANDQEEKKDTTTTVQQDNGRTEVETEVVGANGPIDKKDSTLEEVDCLV